MNLVQQANFLEDVPKDQLVSMSQDPNAQFPPFLVLSEIQRRTTNEKNYQAMLNQPTTTVAEEVVPSFRSLPSLLSRDRFTRDRPISGVPDLGEIEALRRKAVWMVMAAAC